MQTADQCPKCARRAKYERERAAKQAVVPSDPQSPDAATVVGEEAATEAAEAAVAAEVEEGGDGGGSDKQSVPLDEYLVLDADGEVTPVVREPSRRFSTPGPG